MDTDTMSAAAAATLTRPAQDICDDCLDAFIGAGAFAARKIDAPHSKPDRGRRIG
ncbi:hypothetical protein [Albirhodobacter sp. R86504]|jgi:hypothetical protein|uniref:hypothetical protein n=1 Tax=Albirhodobacter sp. R86504 TaxID=3093848 RepID=UPI0036714A7B